MLLVIVPRKGNVSGKLHVTFHKNVFEFQLHAAVCFTSMQFQRPEQGVTRLENKFNVCE